MLGCARFMRALVASGLVLLVAIRAASVHADPATPQISPGRAQREDALRLTRELRGLDHDVAPVPVVAPVRPDSQSHPAPRRDAVILRDRPLVQRWWFWAALGAVTVTVVGVTYESTRGNEPAFPGINCDASGCRL
jgi:hypothetical protein